MEDDFGTLFLPRCCLCFTDGESAGNFLVQIVCRHVFCGYCLNEIRESANTFICPFEPAKSYVVWRDAEVRKAVELLKTDTVKLDKDGKMMEIVDFLRSRINYNGVKCRWEHCHLTIGQYDCPYYHSYNPLHNVNCPLQSECWRLQMCPYKHNSQDFDKTHRKKIAIRSRSVANALVQNDSALLKNVFLGLFGQIPPFHVTINPHITSHTSTSWVYQVTDHEIAHFQKVENDVLEQAWENQANQCTLANGYQAFFSHMILISPNSDFKPITRLMHLDSTEESAYITLDCFPNQCVGIKAKIASLEVEKEVPIEAPADYLLHLCNAFGISVRDNKIFGTQEAVEAATQNFAAPDLFPEILQAVLPFENMTDVLIPLAQEKDILVVGNAIYGAPRKIRTFLESIRTYEYSADFPQDIDEMRLVLVCTELGIEIYDKKLVGRKDQVIAALEKLMMTEADLPPDLDDVELAMTISRVPVEVEGRKIKGSKENVETALRYFQEMEGSGVIDATFNFDVIQAICEKYKCRVEGKRLIGPRGQVKAALEELELNKAKEPQARNFNFQYHVPSPWFLNQEVPLDFEVIREDSNEFFFVHELFSATLQHKRIIKVTKVYNKRLYTNFAFKHESLSQIEGRVLETMMLFHGTRQTDPSLIYLSDEGLDSRLGRGMWGQGTYFAKDAAYSDGFSHMNPEGQQEMFLCEVFVGDYVALGPGPYVKPPQKPDSVSNYHSIQGAGANIWMTYETSMSYPTYLITYQ